MRGNNNERGINLCTEINKILCHPFSPGCSLEEQINVHQKDASCRGHVMICVGQSVLNAPPQCSSLCCNWMQHWVSESEFFIIQRWHSPSRYIDTQIQLFWGGFFLITIFSMSQLLKIEITLQQCYYNHVGTHVSVAGVCERVCMTVRVSTGQWTGD